MPRDGDFMNRPKNQLAPAGRDVLRLRVALAETINRVGLQVAEPVTLTRWPAHLNLVDPRRVPQTEVEAVVVRRLVAPTAEPMPRLAAAADVKTDNGAHGIAVGTG